MTKPERSANHDAFQDEIDHLADIEDMNAIVAIAHELIRWHTTEQLDQIRLELLLKEDIQIPSAEPV